jgi:hypothetical protein
MHLRPVFWLASPLCAQRSMLLSPANNNQYRRRHRHYFYYKQVVSQLWAPSARTRPGRAPEAATRLGGHHFTLDHLHGHALLNANKTNGPDRAGLASGDGGCMC